MIDQTKRPQTPTPPPAPAPRVISPEEWLLERKLELVKQGNCKDLFAELRANDAELDSIDKAIMDATANLQEARRQADESEKLVALNVEGSNADKRKAETIRLLKEDASYQGLLSQIRGYEATLADANIRHDSAKRNSRRIQMEIEYRTAVLQAIR